MRAMRFAAGVQQAGAAGDLFKRAALDAQKNAGSEEVHIDAAIKYLTFVVRRRHVYHSFPMYMILLILVTMFNVADRYDNKDVGNLNEFVEMSIFEGHSIRDNPTPTEGDVWNWINDSTMNLFTAKPKKTGEQYSHPNSPIAFLLLRQYRRKKVPCVDDQYINILPPSLRRTLSISCADMTALETAPIYSVWKGKNVTWFSNVDRLSSTIQGSSIWSQYLSFPATDEQYTVQIPYNTSLPDVVDQIQSLANGWGGPTTSAIIMETFLYSAVQNYFLHVTSTFEIHGGGRIIPFVRSNPMVVFDKNVTFARYVIFLDVALMLMSLWVFYEFVRSMRFTYELQDNGSGFKLKKLANALDFWTFFDLTLGSLLLTTKILRLMMAASTQRVDLETEITKEASFFMYMVWYAETTQVADNLLAWSLLLTYLRVFILARYNYRLSVISETVLSSVHDLIGVCVIICFVLLSYSIAGHYLWGFFHEEFFSLESSLVFLFQIMISGDIQDYQVFSAYHAVYTPLFFLSYILISWLVILNVAVGILAGSFGAVVDTFQAFRTPDWNIIAIFKDVHKYFLKKFVPVRYRQYFGGEYILTRVAKNGIISPISDERTEALHTFVLDRLELIRKLRLVQMQDTVGPTPEYITLSKYTKLAGTNMSKEMVKHIFVKSQQQIGTGNARIRQLRMTKQALDSSVKMKAHLVQQAKLVSEIHKYVMAYEEKKPDGNTPLAAPTAQEAKVLAAVTEEQGQVHAIRAEVTALNEALVSLRGQSDQYRNAMADVQTALRVLTVELRPGAPVMFNRATSPMPSPRNAVVVEKRDATVQASIGWGDAWAEPLPPSIVVQTSPMGLSPKPEKKTSFFFSSFVEKPKNISVPSAVVSENSPLYTDESAWDSDASSTDIEETYRLKAVQEKQALLHKSAKAPPVPADPPGATPIIVLQRPLPNVLHTFERVDSMRNPLSRDNSPRGIVAPDIAPTIKSPVSQPNGTPLVKTQFASVRDMATAPPAAPQFRSFARPDLISELPKDGRGMMRPSMGEVPNDLMALTRNRRSILPGHHNSNSPFGISTNGGE